MAITIWFCVFDFEAKRKVGNIRYLTGLECVYCFRQFVEVSKLESEIKIINLKKNPCVSQMHV